MLSILQCMCGAVGIAVFMLLSIADGVGRCRRPSLLPCAVGQSELVTFCFDQCECPSMS
jgi:hypothetical protein